MKSDSPVPDGYITVPVSGGTLVAREASLAAARGMVARAGSLHAFAASHGTALAAPGRGVAHRVAASPDAEWVVRHYRRGGSVARVLEDRYLRVEAAFVHRTGAVYRADLATGYVPDSRDLASYAFDGPADLPAPDAAWHAAGALLRTAFDAGVIHADLNLGNVLLQFDGARPTAFLIDLDRARIVDSVSTAQREAMLARFHRSRRKLEHASGRRATAGELAAFEDGLCS